eukprot:Rhum_TRINITY_DN23062_c0_g1::Rhum_TRINITY_DN23062_c0_g1_i1::g.176961::m.176961/K15110/SLC25A21, ODC; solute carrier family 25 (mitochondrial 2-oxodicarboxylate transporter), member 21
MELAKQITAGALAGVCEYTTCQPVDMVATRAVLRNPSDRFSMTGEIGKIWKEGGMKGVYRGLGPQILAAVPATIGMYVGERQVASLLRDEKGKLSDAGHFISGVASGVIETTLVCPFEVVKVQLMSSEHSARYRNTFDCFYDIAKHDGLANFYRGYAAMCMRNIIFNSSFFYGVHVLQRDHLPVSTSLQHSLASDFFAGGVMGFVATWIKMPFYVAKTYLQNQHPTSTKYTTTLQTIQTIAKEEGTRSLWKGVFPVSVRASLGSAVCLPTFRLLCSAMDTTD